MDKQCFMDKVKIFKTISVISFLLIYIPNEKFSVLNGVIILFAIMGLFYKDTYSIMNLVHTLGVIISLIFVFSKKKIISLLCFLMTYIYLYPNINFDKIKNNPIYFLTLIIYLIISLYTIYLIFTKKK